MDSHVEINCVTVIIPIPTDYPLNLPASRKPNRARYLGRPTVAADSRPAVEGKLRAVAQGRRLVAAGAVLAAAGGIPRHLQAVAPAFLGPPDLLPGRGGL